MADQWDYPYHQMRLSRRRGQKPWYTRGQHNPADVHWIENLRKEHDFAEMLLEDFSGYASHYGGIVLTETEDRKVYQISSHSTRRGDDHRKATGTLVVDIPKDAHGQVQIKLSLGGGAGGNCCNRRAPRYSGGPYFPKPRIARGAERHPIRTRR